MVKFLTAHSEAAIDDRTIHLRLFPMIPQNLEISEYNEAGSLVATYITATPTSQNVGTEKLADGVDVVVCIKLLLHENEPD